MHNDDLFSDELFVYGSRSNVPVQLDAWTYSTCKGLDLAPGIPGQGCVGTAPLGWWPYRYWRLGGQS